ALHFVSLCHISFRRSLMCLFFFLLLPLPPRSTLFPYTTLFRSRRAFAAITLSLIVIGLGIILISIFDSEKTLVSIAFECFSAYSTVGLSVGITSNLSIYSKLVIIVIMFIGRVSMLTVMIAIFKKVKQQNYRYPIEEITIN